MSAHRIIWPVLAALVTVGLSPVPVHQAGQPPAPGLILVWSDEFDGEEIEKTKWDFDIGNGFLNEETNTWINGWGNGELQYYTREPENAFVKDGMLHIRVLKQTRHGYGYTSARVKTRKRDRSPLFNKKYGLFEFRAKLPTGKGLWSALWMLPQDDKYGTWPASGEIDVMEAKGHEPDQVLGTLHYGARWPNNSNTGKHCEFPAGGTISHFHVYALEWEPGKISWFVDGKVCSTQSFWWSSSRLDGDKGAKPGHELELNPWPAPFDHPFYIVMNVAVGGQFLGSPDKTTRFPAEMVIDYVRVYDKVDGYGVPRARGEGRLPFDKP